MKTETYKRYSREFWIFLPNVMKINPYNFELYRFKVGTFFETQCGLPMMWSVIGEKHLSTFFGNTKDLTPEERGKHLESDTVRIATTLHSLSS